MSCHNLYRDVVEDTRTKQLEAIVKLFIPTRETVA